MKSFSERLRICYKYLFLIILLTFTITFAVYYYISKVPGFYESKSTILVVSDNKKNISNFIIHLKSNDIIGKVSATWDLKYTRDDLNKIISVKNIKNSDLIEIRVRAEIKEHSKEIIDSVIEVFSSNLAEFYPNSYIKIIETSEISEAKEFLNINFLTLVSATLSFIFFSYIFSSFASLDVNIKNHEDLKKYLNIKSLGIIPENKVDDDIKNKKSDNELKIIKNPNSIISESYRMLRTNLDFLDLKVINFTSTTASEGKSETISNIALSFAMIGKSVLLIDCDLRKPVIHRNFSLNRTLGLSDIVLYNRIDEYKNMVQKYKINPEQAIDVITAGSKIYNPSELLNSKRFKNLIEKARNDYDLILIDCPPISLMTDAVIVSKVTDGTAYIIEYNRINCSAIGSSIEQLKDVDSILLGAILTKVNLKKQKKLYGNKYDYYYSNYM